MIIEYYFNPRNLFVFVINVYELLPEDRHGNKPTLPPLQIQWSPELDKKEAQERDQARDQEPAEVLPRKDSGDTRKSPKVFNVSSARRYSTY